MHYRGNLKKRLGQHFLKNQRFARLLVEPLNLMPEETVIEIGPGDGMVTSLLLETGAKVIAIEVDYDLLPNLIKRFHEKPNFNIVHEDIIKLDINELLTKFEVTDNFKVVGSLPYYISKQIINKFLNYHLEALNLVKPMVEKMSFIVQDEVAKEYVSLPPKASFLGMVTRLFSETKKLESIPPYQFQPRPKVNSGILVLTPLKEVSKNIVELQKFLKLGFSSPRKRLMKNLENSNKYIELRKTFEEIGFDENIRASELSMNQWENLMLNLKKAQDNSQAS